ncbi:MAG TPA: biopolymer transporter ExbD [Candidatus Sulfotelmatobacter sp.]|nr:biopolymer transporter ExbD [Candidatus Sulfotelmatobacter sp.]
MKFRIGMCLLVSVMVCAAVAQQDSTKPALREGKSVKMAVSSQAVEMREADAENATVVTVAADGNLFLGIRLVRLSDLAQLNAQTVYVKADARASYQDILRVLDALRGRSVVLLTASPSHVEATGIMPPYGVRVMLGRQ